MTDFRSQPNSSITCYEQDEIQCSDPECLRAGCRIRNEALTRVSPVSETLASFGTDRKRMWILKFEDADRGDMHFDDEGDAHHAYENFSVGWNCTLLETSARKYEVRCGRLVPLDHAQSSREREALEPFAKAADGPASVRHTDQFLIWQELTIGDLRRARTALSDSLPILAIENANLRIALKQANDRQLEAENKLAALSDTSTNRPQPVHPNGDTVTVKIPHGYDSVWDFLNDCGLEAVTPDSSPNGNSK